MRIETPSVTPLSVNMPANVELSDSCTSAAVVGSNMPKTMLPGHYRGEAKTTRRQCSGRSPSHYGRRVVHKTLCNIRA